MNLQELSGSQFPNTLALVCAVGLAVTALVLRSKFRWVFIALALGVAGAIGMKNASYALLVSGPNAENDPDALHNYANALLWISVVQLVIAVCMLVSGVLSKNLGWLAAIAAVACVYAEVSMLDWRRAYLTSDANTPVHYRMIAPSLHWAILVALMGAAAAMVISLVRRRIIR